jgi:hypothetical protein
MPILIAGLDYKQISLDELLGVVGFGYIGNVTKYNAK